MRKYLVLALGLASLRFAAAQDIPEQPIPQLQQQLAVAKNDTARLHLLLRMADAYVLRPGEDKKISIPHFSSSDRWRSPAPTRPNLIYFHKVAKGGHFAAWEEPQLMAEELRAAFRSLR